MTTRVHRIPMPDGSTAKVEAPEEWTREEVTKAAYDDFMKKARYARLASKTAAGASFNFNDELTGLGNALVPFASESDKGYFEGMGERYEEGRDSVRRLENLYGEDKTFWDQALGLAAEMTGGAITGAALLKALKWLRGGKNSLVMAGATEGGLGGVGAGETANERLKGGGAGTVIGGALGTVAKAGEDLLPGVGVRSRATEEVLGGRSVEQAQQQLQQLNQDVAQPFARYMQVEPMGTEAGMLGGTPGMRNKVLDVLEGQQRSQGELIEDSARNITGVRADRTLDEDALFAKRQAEANAAYDPLRGETVDVTPELEATLKTPAGQDAAKNTLRSLRTRRRNPDLQLEDVIDDFDFWHDYQQVLSGMSKKRSVSEVPLSAVEASAIRDMRNEVMTELTGKQAWGDDYALATAKYRENTEIMEALEDSEKFSRLSRDKLRKAVSKLDSDEERTAFVAGVINDVIEQSLRGGDETGNLTRAWTKSPALREKLQIVLGKEKMARLERAMRNISKIPESRHIITGSARTANRLARQERLSAGKESAQMLKSALNLQLGDALSQMLGTNGLGQIPPQVADDMLRAGLSMTPDELARALRQLEGASRTINTGLGATVGAANAAFTD